MRSKHVVLAETPGPGRWAFYPASVERIGLSPFNSAEGSMTRVWNTPVFVIAIIYFAVDGVFLYLTRPIAAWIAKQKLLERVRLWVTSLRPYPSLALFAVPVILLEPAKPLSAYLIGTGHFFAGAVVFIAAEVLKLTVVERLFHLNKKKLLSIRTFAWGYGYWRRVFNYLESTEAWRASRRLVAKASQWFRTQRSRWRQRIPQTTRLISR
jgi:hypothetical protein